jgi:hypothetical protein
VWKVSLSLIPCYNNDIQTQSLGNSAKLKIPGGPVSILRVWCASRVLQQTKVFLNGRMCVFFLYTPVDWKLRCTIKITQHNYYFPTGTEEVLKYVLHRPQNGAKRSVLGAGGKGRTLFESSLRWFVSFSAVFTKS